MISPDHSLDDARDSAALYALGALDASETRAFEAHLESCAACGQETDAFMAVASELAHTVPPQLPDTRLRTRVLECIADQNDLAHATVIEKTGVRFVRSAQLGWTAVSPAIEVKTLSVDRQRGYTTKLVRMAPGASLHPHRHADVEESYVLDGDLLVAGVLMRSGDYCRAEPGSVHTGVTSRGGCLFIAVCSLRDEVLVEA